MSTPLENAMESGRFDKMPKTSEDTGPLEAEANLDTDENASKIAAAIKKIAPKN